MSSRQKFASVEDYLRSFPPDVRRILKETRAIVQRTVPDAEATISYQMSAFKTDRVFLYFAGFKREFATSNTKVF